MAGVEIRPFCLADQRDARELILAGLAEHWGLLDPTRNPDLDDIAASYGGGTFLIAWLDGAIVGTGAYLPQSADTVQIVRMSVASAHRRLGIGRQLLAELCHRARQAGYRRAILETTHTWTDVIAFYERFGFEITHALGDDVYLALEL